MEYKNWSSLTSIAEIKNSMRYLIEKLMMKE